jgi:hypothetical protein
MKNNMSKFGELKTKLLIKLTESYNSGNKKELKDLIKKLKSNNNLVEVYRFYEDMEKTYIQNKETAKVFVETLEPHFIEKIKSIDSECKKFSKVLKDVVVENNELYECLDVLSEENTIHNIVKKIEYKEKFINFLTTKKEINDNKEPDLKIENHSLLNNILVNNFNIKYIDFLNEEQKETFKNIISMTNESLSNEMTTLKMELNKKIENLLNESSESSLVEKLNDVRKQVNESEVSKYNYYKLSELKNGLI